MRKLLYIIPVTIFISCGAFRINTEMGMAESEFKRKNTGYRVAEMNNEYTVYRIMDSMGPDKFVYFQEGKLVKMDEGQFLPNVVIKIEGGK